MINVGTDVEGLWFTNSAVITHPADATSEFQQVPISSSDFMLGTMFYDELNTSEFTLGNVIGKRIHAKVDNINGKFDDFNFNNAFIDIACVAVKDGEDITVNKGTYYIIQPVTPNTVMEFDAVDFCHFLDKKYVPSVNLTYPATLKQILFDIADKLEFSVDFDDFDHSNWSIAEPPDTTYRAVVGWIACVCGCNAKFNGSGMLEFVSYQTSSVGVPTLTSQKVNISLIDTVLGCVKVVNTDGVAWQSVEDNTGIYTLVVKDNQFVNGHEEELMNYLKNLYIPTAAGTTPLHFMNFSATHFNNPLLETMDSVIIKDSKGVTHRTYLTSVAYNVSGTTEISCQFDSEVTNDNQYTSSVDTAIQEAKNKMKEYSNNYILFSNVKEKVIGHNQTVDIAEVQFAVVKPVPVLLLGEYLINVETDSSSDSNYDIYNICELEVTYSFGGATGELTPITTWKPKELYDDGSHILTLIYVIGVEDTATHKFRISIKSKNGTVAILRNKASNLLMGQGLVGATWSGIIRAQDNFNTFDFTPIFKSFTDGASVSLLTPEYGIAQDNFNVLDFTNAFKTFTDSVTINNTIVEMYYGDGESDDSQCGHTNNVWTGAGEVISIYVSVLDHITVNGDNIGTQYLVNYYDSDDWVGLQNGQWEVDASMTKAQLEAITQSQWTGYPLRIKAILADGAKISSIIMHDARKAVIV